MKITDTAALAIICEQPFKTQPTATARAMRLAAVSQKLGREITSFKELEGAEASQLLTQWGSHLSPYLPSERGAKEIQALAIEYQKAHGQAELPI